ncbi:universal stress protein [Cupriavidus sp. WKF15]|uniref:universal stress protein n=1 Tax=Cupriavidus sp. WKF15 TaxID=3032282 RepID=UPI0023E18DE4|nr:universal stress protein [Cupriavidus sp. WKF15]WER48933.1 universal stress protein [Cupriavidus sp. WKF15]
MYSKILVAIDGSECGERGLEEAIGVARACDAELEIVHVIDGGYELAEVRAGLVREGHKLLAQAQARAESSQVRSHAILIDEILAMGDVGNQIRKIVEDSHAQLVVIGTHGRSGIRRMLMGSVAESLVRHCSVPVLLVRAHKDTEAAS